MFLSEEIFVVDIVYVLCLVIVYFGMLLESGYYYCYVWFSVYLIGGESDKSLSFRIDD